MKHHETVKQRLARVARAKRVFSVLSRLFPKAGMMLRYTNDWELLVSVELSAQCTDKKVNEITPALFKRYPTLDDYVDAGNSKKGIHEFEAIIYQTGFYRNKTKNILAAAKMVKHTFHGQIPKTMKEMLMIPGVARKTANVVLGNAHGIVEGIAVDTHVKRLSRVLGLSDEDNPNRIEMDLMELFPKKKWFHVTYFLIEYGRRYCPARKHDVSQCPLGHGEHQLTTSRLLQKRE